MLAVAVRATGIADEDAVGVGADDLVDDGGPTTAPFGGKDMVKALHADAVPRSITLCAE